jgi:hypothetical protein
MHAVDVLANVRPAMVAGLVLASLMAALMRSRSRSHTSSGNEGSPISREASATALPSSAGSESVRSE